MLLGGLALPSCSGGGPRTYRIAILRAVAQAPTEGKIFTGLAIGGVPRNRVKVIGGASPTEAPTTEADAMVAVRRWVKEKVDAIVALSTSSAQAASRAAPGVPILFLSSDPTATGLVADERHPQGKLTGMSYRVPADRTLALLTDAFPSVHRVGCLYPPADPAAVPAQASLARAAENLGLVLTCSTFVGTADAPGAVHALVGHDVEAIVLVNSPTTSRATPAIAAALDGNQLPVVGNTPSDVAELMLAPDATSVYSDLGRQLARVLRGAKIADVPVQDPAHFLLVVNQAIAQRNGHTIPARVLSEATQVTR
jgi:putative ABC transport system substrate-binding protein